MEAGAVPDGYAFSAALLGTPTDGGTVTNVLNHKLSLCSSLAAAGVDSVSAACHRKVAVTVVVRNNDWLLYVCVVGCAEVLVDQLSLNPQQVVVGRARFVLGSPRRFVAVPYVQWRPRHR